MTTALATLESALVAHLATVATFAASVTGATDRRHADEEQYGILGAYTAVPAVIVAIGEPDTGDTVTVPVYRVPVTVTVRHSLLRSTAATHKANADTVAAALWDIAEMNTELSDALTVSSVFVTGESFQRQGRALETSFTLSITISGKD